MMTSSFLEVLKTYLTRYQNGLATGSGFPGHPGGGKRMDFSCFFDQWYYGEGYPIFKLFWEQKGDSLFLSCEQIGSASDVTPLFHVPFELDIMLAGGEKQRVRLVQDRNLEEFYVAVDGLVDRIVFDPDMHLLKTATVSQIMPEGEPFRYGPNPVSSELVIQFPNIAVIDAVRITSISGQEVYVQNGAENPLTLDLSTFADGPYLLELTSSSETYTKRIVKISVE